MVVIMLQCIENYDQKYLNQPVNNHDINMSQRNKIFLESDNYSKP